MKTNQNVIGFVGGIQKFSTEDGPGIRTTVFLKGCPLSCKWCHNPELIDPDPQIMRNPDKCIGCGKCMEICPEQIIRNTITGWSYDSEKCIHCMKCADVCYAQSISRVGHYSTIADVMEKVVQDKGYYEKSGGGVTISGGEMLSQPEFALALARECIANDIPVITDTSGFGRSDVLMELAKLSTHILYDMKLILPLQHKQYTGVSNSLILKNLAMLADDPELNPKLIMRMPLIHEVNDTDDVIRATLNFYLEHGIRHVNLLPYHELGIKKAHDVGRDAYAFTPPDHDRLMEIYSLFTSHQIKTEILGENV